jgi:cytochrome c
MISFLRNNHIRKYGYGFVIMMLTVSCHFSADDGEQTVKEKDVVKDYIRPIQGKNDTLSSAVIEQGKVLISYSDCYTCHKESERSFGPAFRDIAKRYPTNGVYIQILAQKVLLGGTGAWGNAVMLAHPKLTAEAAESMVSYILSLK